MHHIRITGFLLYFSRSKIPHSSSPDLWIHWDGSILTHTSKKQTDKMYWKEFRYTFEKYGSLCFLRTRAIVNKHSFTYLVNNYMCALYLVVTWEYYSEHCPCRPGMLSGNQCLCIITFNPKDFDINVLSMLWMRKLRIVK